MWWSSTTRHRTTRHASSRRPSPAIRASGPTARTGRSAPPSRSGPALELARGHYVWLVEAADLLLPGAFAAVFAGLASTPDVLLVSEVERDVYGKDRSPGSQPVMRNRIVRREQLLDIVAQPDGHSRESDLAAAVLGRAATVEQVDTAVYAHRVLPARVVRQWTDGDPWYAAPSQPATPEGTTPHQGHRPADRAARATQPDRPAQRRSVRPATRQSVAARSTRTSRCSRRTGARPTRATRAPSSRRPASWRPGSVASGWSSAGPSTSCRAAWSTSSKAAGSTTA